MNGWTNYETWNVALWIQNDEGLYETALRYQNSNIPYRDFVVEMKQLGLTKTPDGVEWLDWRVNVPELNEMIQEF